MSPARRRRLKPLIPVASMGDIAFLLIIFFILTSNFMKEAHIKMQYAMSSDVERLKESVISVSVDTEGEAWLQGEPCEISALEGALREMVEGRPKQTVMLKVDRGVAHERYGEVVLALSRAEVEIALVGDRLP